MQYKYDALILAVTVDGKPIFPEEVSEKRIDYLKAIVGQKMFMAQYMNMPEAD